MHSMYPNADLLREALGVIPRLIHQVYFITCTAHRAGQRLSGHY